MIYLFVNLKESFVNPQKNISQVIEVKNANGMPLLCDFPSLYFYKRLWFILHPAV